MRQGWRHRQGLHPLGVRRHFPLLHRGQVRRHDLTYMERRAFLSLGRMDRRRTRIGAEKPFRKLVQLSRQEVFVAWAKGMAVKRERRKRSEVEPIEFASGFDMGEGEGERSSKDAPRSLA